MLKTLQARLQQYLSWELPDAKERFRKGRGPKLPTSIESYKKAREFQKNIYFFIDYAKVFVWITTNCAKFFKRWEYQTTLPASWEICLQVKKHQLELDVETDWFQIGKEVYRDCILLPCLFNLDAEYILRNAGLDETQAGIKIAGRDISNLRYPDDTTLMAKSEEELKNLLIKVEEDSEKVGLKLNIQKTKIMASGPITSWQIVGETMETMTDFIFLGSKINADG